MKTSDASKHIASVNDVQLCRYTRYLKRITPRTAEERFRRWLFAYASVHSTWRMNCKLYYALRDLAWIHDFDELKRRIIDVRAGLHNNRAEWIHEFTEYYWQHPDWFLKTKFESWSQYRLRMQNKAKGIGQAKSAFMVELIYPLRTQVICVDTHILQLYGYTAKHINERGIRKSDMDAIESHWAIQCAKVRVPPVIARWTYWDNKQGQADSRYWSFVFEEEDYNDRLARLARVTERPTTIPGHERETVAGNDSAVPIVHEGVPDAAVCG